MNKCLALVLLAAVAVSADVRDALRNSRQAIILPAQGIQRLQLQRPQLQLVAQPLLVRQQEPAFQAVEQPAFEPAQSRQPFWRILSYTQENDPAGFYRYSFETENGIRHAEEGTVINPGSNSESTAKRGNYAYTAPDGTPISVSYVADENGFRASGEHLPTPPPIPEAILRSLEQNAREEAQGNFQK